MSWPVIVYIAAPILSLLLLVAAAWRVWRRFRGLLRDVRATGERAGSAGNEVTALMDRLPNEPIVPMGAGSAGQG
jgi:hypothetical protein